MITHIGQYTFEGTKHLQSKRDTVFPNPTYTQPIYKQWPKETKEKTPQNQSVNAKDSTTTLQDPPPAVP